MYLAFYFTGKRQDQSGSVEVIQWMFQLNQIESLRIVDPMTNRVLHEESLIIPYREDEHELSQLRAENAALRMVIGLRERDAAAV
jgi:hypothetical protein